LDLPGLLIERDEIEIDGEAYMVASSILPPEPTWRKI